MPIWTWATSATNAADPTATTGNDPFGTGLYQLIFKKDIPWSAWVPTDDAGDPIISPGNYNTIIGWRDDTVVGGGANERIFGYSTRLSFDWDGYLFDRIGTLFTGPANLFKTVPGGRNVNKSPGLKGFAKGISNVISMFTGFDGDANLVFANRFDYQYWGSKLNLTRRCDPTEITVTNMDKYINLSYFALFLYFTISVTSQIFIRMNKNAIANKTAGGMANISNTFLQGFLADNAILGLLKWWDERCIILLETKKEYDDLKKKIEMLEETGRNIGLNVTKTATANLTLEKKHNDLAKKALENIRDFTVGIYTDGLIQNATEKSTVAMKDFNAKVFKKKNKIT